MRDTFSKTGIQGGAVTQFPQPLDLNYSSLFVFPQKGLDLSQIPIPKMPQSLPVGDKDRDSWIPTGKKNSVRGHTGVN